MALIHCPECERDGISDTASECPDCRYNFEKAREKAKTTQTIFVSLLLILGMFGTIWYMGTSGKYPIWTKFWNNLAHVFESLVAQIN